MISISETADGYEVSSAAYLHTFQDRNKAIFAARVIAIECRGEDGQEMPIMVPMGWGEAILIGGGATAG